MWCSGYDARLLTCWSVERNQAPAVGGELSCWETPAGSRGPGAAGVPSDVGHLDRAGVKVVVAVIET